MPAKKTKKPEPPVKTEPTVKTEPVVEPVKEVAQPQTVGVVVQPPDTEVKPVEVKPEPVVVPAAAMVKEGALASSIADLAKVVDNSQATKPVVENKEFVPVGVEPEPQVVTNEEAHEVSEPGEKPAKKSGGQIWWVLLAFLVGLGLGVGMGYWLWGRGTATMKVEEKTEQKAQESKPVPTTATQPSPTVAQKIDRTKLRLQVLNGTGGKGVAAKAQALLESMGYKGVAVGNAEKEDYAITEIALKIDKMMYFETLKADLSSKYQVASEASKLATGSDYDAVVTIGAK